MLSVSKTPIREALRQLEIEGLVKNIPGKGTRVSDITYEYILETFEIREIIESGCIKRLSLFEDKEELYQKREEFKLISRDKKDIVKKTFEGHTFDEIHKLIVDSLGNKSLTEIYSRLMDRIERIRYNLGKRFIIRRSDEIKEEHIEILDAILKGDPEDAEKMMIQHLDNALKNITIFKLNRKK